MPHAFLSPSAAHRWIACPGAPTLERLAPDTSSTYASEGTAAHQEAADALTGGAEPSTESIKKYIDVIEKLRGQDGELKVEFPLRIESITGEPGAYGTADAVIVHKESVTIVDYKHGAGVVVAADSPQLLMYAIAAADMFNVDTAYTCVVQPRAIGGGNIDLIFHSEDDLAAHRKYISDAAKLAHEAAQRADTLSADDWADRYLITGEHCRFCKALPTCPKVERYLPAGFRNRDMLAVKDSIKERVESLDAKDPDTIAYLYTVTTLVKYWVAAVEQRAYALAQENRLPGYKLVEGKRTRKWRYESDDLVKELRAAGLSDQQIYEMSVRSPAALEKVIGKTEFKRLAELIEWQAGKPRIVRQDEPGTPIDLTADMPVEG